MDPRGLISHALHPGVSPTVAPLTLALVKPLIAMPREPVYLASQIASICDVDLKTVHNWCAPRDPLPELTPFRSPGGHLRFRHETLLGFLYRWGYPLPDVLLRDRPHVLLIDPSATARARHITTLGLRRPGDSHPSTLNLPTDATLGLWIHPLYYLHVWPDPLTALVSLGERIGAGTPVSVVVLPASERALDAWLPHGDPSTRYVLLGPHGMNLPETDNPRVLAVLSPDDTPALQGILDRACAAWQPAPRVRSPRRPVQRHRARRAHMPPREPLYLASHVASLWAVDLKTVHNWVARGELEAFRTPGRQFRIRRRALVHFLQRYAMAIPDELLPARPKVLLLDPDATLLPQFTPGFTDLFDVVSHTDPFAALVAIGRLCAGAGSLDAIIASLPTETPDRDAWLQALAVHPDARYVPVVRVTDEASAGGAWTPVASAAVPQVSVVLQGILGMSP